MCRRSWARPSYPTYRLVSMLMSSSVNRVVSVSMHCRLDLGLSCLLLSCLRLVLVLVLVLIEATCRQSRKKSPSRSHEAFMWRLCIPISLAHPSCRTSRVTTKQSRKQRSSSSRQTAFSISFACKTVHKTRAEVAAKFPNRKKNKKLLSIPSLPILQKGPWWTKDICPPPHIWCGSQTTPNLT
jgi:hypothetical protein